jgi:hypothetical protein
MMTMIINEDQYPWLKRSKDSCSGNLERSYLLSSPEAQTAIHAARIQLSRTGAVLFPNFLTEDAIRSAVDDLRRCEDDAFTTDTKHTAYLKDVDIRNKDLNSVYNHEMRTIVASTAFDELSPTSVLPTLYRDPRLLELVSLIVDKKLYLSADPLGCCSVNVFRPNYYHSFHFDESEFSTTIMLQAAEDPTSGLFQYTEPLRESDMDLAFQKTASAIHRYDAAGLGEKQLVEQLEKNCPILQTLDFQPGTLLVLAGSKSLHRVTQVRGSCSRLVAVLTFASHPGFCNSESVQKMFWGRSSRTSTTNNI